MNTNADITQVIGAIPYRMALAGGWIDQPFVSRHNPTPPGAMVVVDGSLGEVLVDPSVPALESYRDQLGAVPA